MRLACFAVPERLGQDELVRVVNAPGPLEEDVAGLRAGGCGEVRDKREPFFAPGRAYGET